MQSNRTTLYNTYNTIQYNTIQYNTIQYNTIPLYFMFKKCQKMAKKIIKNTQYSVF